MPRLLWLALSAIVCGSVATALRSQTAVASNFDQVVAPFVQQNCAGCHNDKLKVAGLVLTTYHDAPRLVRDRDIWEKVIRRVRNGEMPPKGMPRPKAEAIAAVTNWIEEQFAIADRTTPVDPGHLTAHRLNRIEYDNTIRDLLGMKIKASADFPADDSGYGFDNIGDVLSISPVLMEKYLNAATKIANKAIPPDTLPKATRVRYSPERGSAEDGLTLEHDYEFPAEGDYEWRVSVGGKKEAFRIHLFEDGKPVKTEDVLIEKDKPRTYEVNLHETYGPHVLSAQLEARTPSPEEQATAQELAAKEQTDFEKAVARHPEDAKQIALQRAVGNPPTYIDNSELRGPYEPLPPPMPASYRHIFICGHAPGHHTSQCARQAIEHLMPLAYRRQATLDETDRIVRLVESAQKDGMTVEQSMRIGLEAILVSPNFLFRIERDPQPNALTVHRISDYELASRLSYFLWSSMPDQTLFDLAARRQLRNANVLSAQLKRMLKDPKSDALVENFAGQWLELRNLDSVHPDPDEFPQFDNALRKAMYTESKMFVQSVVRDDKSILDFIDGKYTFVNEKLAKFYGLTGVTGTQFRRVSLDGTERSGVLTQAAVLTVTSYPTRTSPVLRGKWILENVLNAPPPPPPPGVGSLDASGGPVAGTMRQQMEKHRANPMCASCHVRMDPLGFALENYNAIGQWRTQDANQPIDASGVLPDGKSFQSSAELKAILAQNKDTFAECLTEKLMIYALGRGLESYDRRAVKGIVANLAKNEYRFSALIEGIVNSAPFQMGRGVAPSTTTDSASGGPGDAQAPHSAIAGGSR